MAQIRLEGICRGEGHGYVALGSNTPLPTRLRATARTEGGSALPCQVVPRTAPAPGTGPASIALVLPLVNSDLVLELFSDDTTLWHGSFSRLGSKVSSRLLTKRNPQLAAELRGIERACGADLARVEVTDIWPAAEANAWRVRAVLPGVDAATPVSVDVRDGRGLVLAAQVVVMEDHVVPSTRTPGSTERLMTFSLLIPEEVRHACVSVGCEDLPGMQGFRCLLPYQTEGLLARSRARIAGPAADEGYGRWLAAHRTSARELEAQRLAASDLPDDAPCFSVLAPTDLTPEADAALRCQTYPRWELAKDVAAATGTHLVTLGHADVLEPDALWCLYEHLLEHDADLLYADSDALGEGGRSVPCLRPDPDYGRLLSHDYLGSMVVIKRTALDSSWATHGPDGISLGRAAALELLARGGSCEHVARVLVHEMEPTLPADDASCRAIEAHLASRGIAAHAEPTAHPGVCRIRYALPEPAPHVSIVIPNKDQQALLETCVTSILDRTTYPSYDITIVENNSSDPETFAYYKRLERIPRVHVMTWEPDPQADAAFNYSAIVNAGARSCTGDLIVFLNNDTEVISEDWLQELAGHLMRPEVGVVGAKLLFGDGLVQHAGLSANPNGDFLHPNQNLAADEAGYLCSACVCSDLPMVTGACQMVSRTVFDELGGYDEGLAVGYNDGDFCLRASEAGYQVTFTPHALLHHREFSTRGREASDTRLRRRYLREKARFMGRHAEFLAAGDPSVNVALDRFSPWRELRHDEA